MTWKWNTDLVIPVSGMFYHSGRSALRFRSSWRGCKGWKKNVLLIHIIFFVLFGERGYIFFSYYCGKDLKLGWVKSPLLSTKRRRMHHDKNVKKGIILHFIGIKFASPAQFPKPCKKVSFFLLSYSPRNFSVCPFLPQFYGFPFRYHGWRNYHGNITNWQNISSNWMTWPTLSQFKSLAIG